MNHKIQLQHPAGKKAIKMDKEKYELLKSSLIRCLNTNGKLSHTEILQTVTKEFKTNNILFEGSLDWHLEWVKLDLEAQKVITRLNNELPIKYILA